jgi:riboflavin-specific deaminase-like protein
MRFRELLNDAGTVDESVFDDLGLETLAGPDRPYVALNMITSLDGKAAVAGRTAALGSGGDRVLFHRLRAQADAVMAGAGTIRAERYGPLIRDRALRELRERRGLAVPLAVIVSASLRIDPAIPLLADPESKVLVLTNATGTIAGARAQIEYLRGDTAASTLRLEPLLARLRSEHGVRTIVGEGGPTLNASLFHEALVDELFVSIAPKLIGGPAPLTIVEGEPLDQPVELGLVSLLEESSYLFGRYAVRR